MTPKQYRKLADRMFGEYVKRLNKTDEALPYLRMWFDASDMYYASIISELRESERKLGMEAN